MLGIVTGAVGFLMMTAYWPGLSGAATSPRWALFTLLPLALIFGSRIEMTLTHLAGAVFLAWCLITATWAPGLSGLDGVALMLLGVCAFTFGSQLADLRPLFIGAALGIAISSGIAIAQVFGWTGVEQVASPAGLFINKNRLAEASAIVLVYALYRRMWLLIPGILPAIVLTGSRGALIAAGFAIVLPFMFQRRSLPLRSMAVGALAIGAITVVAFGNPVSISERFDIWRVTVQNLTGLGHGLGSFADVYAGLTAPSAALTRPDHAHNDFLELFFETGLVGALIVLPFAALLSLGRLTAERLALITILVESLFAFPFHSPATVFLGAVVAGRAAADGVPVRGLVALGRDLLCARLARWRGYSALDA